MKIAICLSGQPRSIEYTTNSILNHFSGDGHQYDFFCHVWNYNTWKLINVYPSPPEPVNILWLADKISAFNPKAFKIGGARELAKVLNGFDVPYASLAYSLMVANHLKRKYELENNFRYDYVVKARFDNVFIPDTHLRFPEKIEDRKIYYPHLGRIPYEYNRLNPSDCIFVGDSWGMDICTDYFRYLFHLGKLPVRLDNVNATGPGTTMYEYATARGVNLCSEHIGLQEVFYRKEAIGLDSITQYQQVADIHCSFYKPL